MSEYSEMWFGTEQFSGRDVHGPFLFMTRVRSPDLVPLYEHVTDTSTQTMGLQQAEQIKSKDIKEHKVLSPRNNTRKSESYQTIKQFSQA